MKNVIKLLYKNLLACKIKKEKYQIIKNQNNSFSYINFESKRIILICTSSKVNRITKRFYTDIKIILVLKNFKKEKVYKVLGKISPFVYLSIYR